MEISESSESANADYTPAVPLEISQEVAEQADELLRELAEDAGLETALIVDQSGALVTGISAEEEVTVEVISALVAGASGAMKILVRELGETGEIESLHQGSDRTIYLREIVGRFVLVGVAEAALPVGIIREKSNQMRGRISELLESVTSAEPVEAVSSEAVSVTKSLREVAMARAAERAASTADSDDDSLAEMIGEDVYVDDEDFDLEKLKVVGDESTDEEEQEDEDEVSIFEVDDEQGEEVAAEEEEREPTEVLEPLDLNEPEIVIEKSDGTTVVSPFEMEEDEEEEPVVPSPIVLEEGAPVESIFELEVDEEVGAPEEEEAEEKVEEEDSSSVLDGDLSDIFEVDTDDEREEPEPESTADDEVVAESSEDEEDEPVFELDAEDDSEAESAETGDEEEEEEVRGSGPFYF